MALKRTAKLMAGRASLALAPFVPPRRAACILTYHRVADVPMVDPERDNWNVPPDRFEQHMRALAAQAEVVALDELPEAALAPAPSPRPLVCVTFDDGFASVVTRALPVMRRYGIRATLFVVTRFVGSREPMPFDAWSRHNADRVPIDTWRPLSWRELERCAADPLVTIGAHSQDHLDGRHCTPRQLTDEAGESRRVLSARLGPAHARAYAYPYGSTRLGEVTPAYVAAVQAAGYERAVSTDLGMVTGRSNRFLLPRVEAAATDTAAVLLAKVRGSLLPLWVSDRLRQANRPN